MLKEVKLPNGNTLYLNLNAIKEIEIDNILLNILYTDGSSRQIVFESKEEATEFLHKNLLAP